jgi:hypothetical protein
MFTRKEIDALVQEIAQRQTKPIIDASIDKIADEIAERTGNRPAKQTIWLSLSRIGAVASGKKFVYRWKDDHE